METTKLECIEPSLAVKPTLPHYYKTNLPRPLPFYEQKQLNLPIEKLNGSKVQVFKFSSYFPFKKSHKTVTYNSKYNFFSHLEGKWTQEEDDLLKKGIQKFGRHWTDISYEFVKTRSPSACIKRSKVIENKLPQ